MKVRKIESFLILSIVAVVSAVVLTGWVEAGVINLSSELTATIKAQ